MTVSGRAELWLEVGIDRTTGGHFVRMVTVGGTAWVDDGVSMAIGAR